MSALPASAANVAPPARPRSPSASVTALALADARRFARHPLFLLGLGVVLLGLVLGLANRRPVDVGVEMTVVPAFFLGVFGFVVAHRLTTSLRRSGDLPDTLPVVGQRRALALCLACLVPATASLLVILVTVSAASIWPPTLPAGRVAWFGYEPTLDVWAVLVADAVLAALGGPLLGVAVARWAPFRGSALLGTVVLVGTVIALNAVPARWNAIAPWVIFSEERLAGGEYQESWLRGDISPAWYAAYAFCLCGLAVVAALLRDGGRRRPLLVAGGCLTAAALGSLMLSAS